MGDATVIDLSAEQTHDLRRRVLRTDTPSTDVEWSGDDLDATLHLGVVEVNAIVAISTWLASPSPDLEPHHVGIQLRGMATDPAMRGHGFGATLLRAGIERAGQSGADHVWANARSAVLGFYVAHGFEITSGEFENAETAVPHRRILLRLPRPADVAPLEK
jgi:predicted GNAT family N-acyltransferase